MLLNALNDIGHKARNSKKTLDGYVNRTSLLKKDIEKVMKNIIEAKRENTDLQIKLNEILLNKLSQY